MSRLRAWWMAAALTVGAIAPTVAIAADSPNTTTDTRPLYKRMFSAPKPAQPGPVVRNGAVAAPPGQPPISQPLSPDAMSAALQAEQAAYLRRLDVCVKLQQIALDSSDETLYGQALELQRRADELYKQRSAALGARNVRAPLPNTNNAFAASVELAPEKPFDPKSAAAQLVAPAAPVPVSGTAGLALPPGQETIREVNR